MNISGHNRICSRTMAKVGLDGGCFGKEDTARRMRAGEHPLLCVSCRLSCDRWGEEGRTEDGMANHEVERILATRAAKEPGLNDGPVDHLPAI